MQYMVMFYETADVIETRNEPDKAPAYWGGWMAYVDALRESGVMVSGNGLMEPSKATTVRITDGQRLVQDGPVADSKEQLGGYFIIETPDIEVALAWAARSPAASAGAVEVRPVLPPMQ